MKKRILGTVMAIGFLTIGGFFINTAEADCTLTTNNPTKQCAYFASSDTYECVKWIQEKNCASGSTPSFEF